MAGSWKTVRQGKSQVHFYRIGRVFPARDRALSRFVKTSVEWGLNGGLWPAITGFEVKIQWARATPAHDANKSY